MNRILLPLLLLTVPTFAVGTVYFVAPDGSGDFATIQAAIDSTISGDVVELADGTFHGDGNRDLDFRGKEIVLRSASGDGTICILDVEGTESEPHRGLIFHSGETPSAVVEGIGFNGGRFTDAPWGSAVLCVGGSSPTFRACLFTNNSGSAFVCSSGAVVAMEECEFSDNFGWKGGGLLSLAGHVTLDRCRFLRNEVDWTGGGIHGHSGELIVNECEFRENRAPGGSGGAIDLIYGTVAVCTGSRFRDNEAQIAGAVSSHYCTLALEGCTFIGNTAGADGGAIATSKVSTTSIRNCTFVGNGAVWGSLLLGESSTILENTIIAFGSAGAAIQVAGNVDLSCCDIFGNPGGDWTGGIADQYGVNGNIAEDPYFCDLEDFDLSLRADSPCAPFSAPDPECDLIGAWPVDCGATSTNECSWGAIKGLFR